MFGKGLEVDGIAGGILRAGLLPDPRFRMTLTRLLCFAAALGLADPMTGFADPVIFDGAQGTVALEAVPAAAVGAASASPLAPRQLRSPPAPAAARTRRAPLLWRGWLPAASHPSTL